MLVRVHDEYNDIAGAPQPVAEAVRITYLDRFICRPEHVVAAPSRCFETTPADWYGHGLNHREKDGYLVRDIETAGWGIDFATFEEFGGFLERYGAVASRWWACNLIEVSVPSNRCLPRGDD